MRKIIAVALALVAGLLPAVTVAQAPPPVPALPDTERRTSYSITSETGPFAVNFALYGDGTDYQNWVQVFLISGSTVTQLTGVTDWTLSSPSGSLATLPRPITDATITLTSARTGTLQIVGARRPRRTSQFNENRGVAARDLNQVFTDVVAENRERWDQDRRTVQAPPGETLNVLPPAASRAGTSICFDGSGQVGTCNIAAFTDLGAGNVVGNPGAAPGPAVDATLTSILDRAMGSGNGFSLFRGPLLWTGRLWSGGDCVNPSVATFGCVFSNPASGGSVLSGIDNSGNPQRAAQMALTGQNSLLVAVGRQGFTQPAFSVDSSTANSITGITIAAQAAGNGVNISAIGETNVPIIINGAGTGTINLNPTATGIINAFRNVFINHNTTPTLTFGNAGNVPGTLVSQGSGGFLLRNSAGEIIAAISPPAASGINSYGKWLPSTTGNPVLTVDGPAADMAFQFTSKGAGSVVMGTNGGQAQVIVTHTAASARVIFMTGSVAGNPLISTNGGQLDVTNGAGGTSTFPTTTGTLLNTGNYMTAGNFPNLRFNLNGVNANSVADTPITINLPTGATKYRLSTVGIKNVGTTASLTTAQFGIFSAAAGGGTAWAAAQALAALTNTGTGVTGAFMAANLGTTPTVIFNSGTQYFFRITTAQGAAATIDVSFVVEPYP